MKVTWEASDIRAGMRVRPPSGADERWMVGYRYQPITSGPESDRGQRYTLVSLVDGLEAMSGSVGDVANHLNDSGMLPADT
jgi:hypothetical protein